MPLFVSNGNEAVLIHKVGDCLFCPIPDGQYAGEVGRDVMLEAIQWWDKYLSAIETEIEEGK
jgi:hypothetical protein